MADSKKGKTYEEYYGIERAKQIKEKSSKSHKGQIPTNLGQLRLLSIGRAKTKGMKIHSEEEKKIRSERFKGNKYRLGLSPWNKGKGKGSITSNGYKIIRINGKPIPEHRHIWEEYHGKIPNSYEIHHKDGNRLNNNLDNLEMLSKSDQLGNIGLKER